MPPTDPPDQPTDAAGDGGSPGKRREGRPPPPNTESDPRFPSGRWMGFWLQAAFRGRQYMNPLHITFVEGRIAGHGTDCVGDFILAGTYDLKTGRCTFTKTYLGEHAVKYDGCNQNDGMWIWGTWEIRSLDRGGFHLWPWGEHDPTQRHRHTARDLPDGAEAPPAERKRRVLVPSIGDE